MASWTGVGRSAPAVLTTRCLSEKVEQAAHAGDQRKGGLIMPGMAFKNNVRTKATTGPIGVEAPDRERWSPK